MRRSKRVKSMARAWRSAATLGARLWRAAPWLILGGILLAVGVLGGTSMRGVVPVWLRWTALAAAAMAPLAALLLDPPRRPLPGSLATLGAYGALVAAIGYLSSELITTRVNTFYSASLLGEGALVLYALQALQAGMRRVAPPPDSAAPRAADAFIDGVRVMLLAMLVTTGANFLPLSVGAFFLGLWFALIAVVLRTPAALAALTRPRSG